MIEAGQANAAHHHAGGAPLVVGMGTGHGVKGIAKAVSMGSHTTGPHPMILALAGIIEGTKKSIAAINAVLTIL